MIWKIHATTITLRRSLHNNHTHKKEGLGCTFGVVVVGGVLASGSSSGRRARARRGGVGVLIIAAAAAAVGTTRARDSCTPRRGGVRWP